MKQENLPVLVIKKSPNKIYTQNITPDLNISCLSGGCLRYVDDAGKASTRRASASAAADAEKAAGRLNNDQLPFDVWIVLFYSLGAGKYAGRGHVQLARKLRDGSMEIHDSEVHSGLRGIYTSISEVIDWLEDYDPVYLGWSTDCDGINYAKNIVV